ncbi:MAG: NAD(P)/FAD-dependent oxidoreductase, partial [bacterium]
MNEYDVLILGGGAAGCMAAIQAGLRGRRVLLLDGGKRIGGKIPISGGGRCNFTNREAEASRYLSSNPRFIHSAFSRFSALDTENWLAQAGIAYHEKKLGQLFCDRSAMEVVELLEAELSRAAVEVRLMHRVEGLEKAPDGRFRAWGSGAGGVWEAWADKAVVALGGLSYPTLGASDMGLSIARGFDLKLVDVAPALDGFVFADKEQALFEGLQGLSLDARLECGGHAFDEAVLFTHNGLSGPAALQGSLYWRPGKAVTLDLWPGGDAQGALLETKRRRGNRAFVDWLAERWPRRLAERWDLHLGPGRGALQRVSDEALRQAAGRVKGWSFIPAKTVGWHKAEVMRGGVDTAGLDQRSMACRAVEGLHFVGEAVD